MKEKRRHILAIINPVSGIGNKNKIPRLIDTVVDQDTNDVSIVMSEYAGHAREIAAMAVNQGMDVVVAIGGDGTINEVGSALCGTPTALAIVPCGSGNGLARHLRISMNASRALQVLNNGVVSRFDFCTVNGRPFFCTCGMGFDATVSYKFSNEGTRGFIPISRLPWPSTSTTSHSNTPSTSTAYSFKSAPLSSLAAMRHNMATTLTSPLARPCRTGSLT